MRRQRLAWEAQGWVGSDLNRLWLRSEGERARGSTESADVEAFYGRAIAPWWDAVAGVRHDFGFGGASSRTYVALGVIGLAAYRFEVKATAYLGESGQVGLGAETEYEMLFSNRLIGQWLIEGEAWSKDDPAAAIGNGLSTIEPASACVTSSIVSSLPMFGVVLERAYGTRRINAAHAPRTLTTPALSRVCGSGSDGDRDIEAPHTRIPRS